MKKGLMNFLKNNWFLILIIVIIGGSFIYSNEAQEATTKTNEVNISQVVEQVKNGQVESVSVNGTRLDITLKEAVNGNKNEFAFKEADISLTQYGITPDKVKIDIKDTPKSSPWVEVLSFILPVLLMGGLLWFMLRQAQGANNQAMSFGKSRARMNASNANIKFADVAGSEESKKDLIEVVDFLQSPAKYRELGAEIPKGVLLIGPPGTGKTLLAKAVAGEAGVPFFSISGSEFVEMFVGVGASRVRDLFAKAKRNAPCIIFIDEIDAVGRQRGAGLGGSHDEREQTLNQILVELDGFDTDTGVIVMAATNRPDVLDPALLRPGRFDRRVLIDLPDIKEREAILQVHAKGKPFTEEVNLNVIAQKTPGFSGADLKNVLNESAILAARNSKKAISMTELNDAVERVVLGPERKTRVIHEDEKKITAYHEAGHALVSHILPNGDPVHKISIISRGRALGYTWNMPEQDKLLYSKSHFEDEIAILLSGREAELMIFGELTTGAQNDLQQASKIARKMVTEFGMSEKIGAMSFHGKDEMVFLGRDLAESKNYSEKTAQVIDDEVAVIITKAEAKAHEVLTKSKDLLSKIADVLMEKETIEREEFEKLITDFSVA
ncbi:MAG TPA: ATP-dependent zinc metalloprotease FtsH [Patescibacteria group bacterium]|nr:ATP-dependent zinc metalloprotease FtsH [Patescibacteria group bacterium]